MKLQNKSKFILILGVSGVGKSSLIREISSLDNRFSYIKPVTNRVLREGENDKIYSSEDKIIKLKESGDLIIVNEIYGNLYGTPRKPIITALNNSKFPILDWPVDKLELMKKYFPKDIYTIYILPPSLEELRNRMSIDGRIKFGSRWEEAVKELKDLNLENFDYYYKNDGSILEGAKKIINKIMSLK